MIDIKLEDAIKLFINGDDNAFETIYEQTKKTVYLSIKTIIKNETIVEDLMQDTYMKALKNLSSYKLGTNFKAWIAIIARNIALNEYKKRKRETLTEEIDSPAIFKNNIEIQKAFELLDAIEHDIIIYHIVLNFKFEDIAKIMKMKRSTIFSKYKSALKKIKREI